MSKLTDSARWCPRCMSCGAEFYTYIHCKPNGEPFYVGKGQGKRSHDFRNGRNRHHKNIVSKYGKENILVYVFPCESEKQAFDDEINQIAQMRRDGCALTNVTIGGDGASGRVPSDETRAKWSKALIGNKRSLGKSHSEETKQKISAANTGRAVSAETREKLSRPKSAAYRQSMIGNSRALGKKLPPRTKEHAEKLSAALKGKTKGKPWTEARRNAYLLSKAGNG